MNPIRKREDQFVETEVDGEVVVMNTATGHFYALEASGLAIWRAINGVADRDTILAQLALTYGESEAAIAAEVDTFLDHLDSAGLIARSETS